MILMKNKLKSILGTSSFRYTLVLFLGIFGGELIFRSLAKMTIFDYATLRIGISTLFLSLIFAYILSFCHKLAAKIIIPIIIFATNFYAFLQLGFNNFLGVYMSFGTSSQLGAVVDYIKDFLHSFSWTFYLCFIPFILVLLYIIFFEKKFAAKKDLKLSKVHAKKKFYTKSLYFAGALLILVSLYYLTITLKFMQNDLQLIDNKELIVNPSVPSTAINQFGTTMFCFGDIRITLFPVKEEVTFAYNGKKKTNTISDYTRVIDDTAWNNLISNEKKTTLNTLNNYFISRDITDRNEYTGMFKGKNVIVVMMESVNDIIINPDLFPNFYKLYSEGWHWENNYSPRNSCATGNNEMSGMLSLYSINNNCTANTYKNNTYFESIFGVYNDAGYQTSSMHDYTEAYYRRSTIHQNMGSQTYYGVQKLGIKYQNEYVNWASDEDFMNKVLEILDDREQGKPFMTWLTTVSGHQPYSVSSILGDKYLSDFKALGYSTEMSRYMSKIKVTDEGLGVLIKGLEERGILDDTVIVLYGDHYPYGMSKNTISKVLSYNLDDYEIERVPFVIYNSQMEPKSFSEYTSYINIVPTLANLFDLNYDPRLYMGTDLLSSSYESRVVFADGSWKNEKAYYNASNGKLKSYSDDSYSAEEIKAINDDISYKMKMSSLAIKNNYFNYLKNALNNYSTQSTEVAVNEN